MNDAELNGGAHSNHVGIDESGDTATTAENGAKGGKLDASSSAQAQPATKQQRQVGTRRFVESVNYDPQAIYNQASKISARKSTR